jgi:hypothetical protein
LLEEKILHPLLVEEYTWEKVRKSVLRVNPELAKIIDDLSIDASYTFFQASYPYGSQIVEKGEFCLPTKDNSFLPLRNSKVSSYLKEKLGYNAFSNPVSLVLKNSLDLFIELDDRIVNHSLIPAGSIFGLWRVLDQKNENDLFFTPISIWDMTAGARSVFMLPKIADANGFRQLQKKYNLQIDKPQELRDHWNIFRAITNHPSFENSWTTDLLFFSKKWFEKLEDPAWQTFKLYLINTAWTGTKFWRNQYIWDLTFSRIQAERGLKPCPYIADMVAHILAITIGAVPGFRPALNDTLAPIKKLQQVFEEEYKLKYAPIIIEPATFSVFDQKNRPVYYSLNYQTAIKMSKKSSNRSSTVTDIYQIRSLLMKYMQDILNKNLNITDTLLYEMIKIVEYDFFHHDSSEYKEIFSSTAIFDEDSSFKEACAHCKVQEMPKNPPFFNGCVKISGEKAE